MSRRRCECCAERSPDVNERQTRVQTAGEGAVFARAPLCDDCAGAGHGRGQCKLCGTLTWHCARLTHVAERHPLALEKYRNAPEPDLTTPPRLTPLGKLWLPQ